MEYEKPRWRPLGWDRAHRGKASAFKPDDLRRMLQEGASIPAGFLPDGSARWLEEACCARQGCGTRLARETVDESRRIRSDAVEIQPGMIFNSKRDRWEISSRAEKQKDRGAVLHGKHKTWNNFWPISRHKREGDPTSERMPWIPTTLPALILCPACSLLNELNARQI